LEVYDNFSGEDRADFNAKYKIEEMLVLKKIWTQYLFSDERDARIAASEKAFQDFHLSVRSTAESQNNADILRVVSLLKILLLFKL
jgi:hypothetical protein